MTHESGSTVKALQDLMAEDGSIVPIGTTVTVIGHRDEDVIVEFTDWDTGEKVTAYAKPWELLRQRVAR